MVGKTRTTRGLAVSAGGSWLVAIGGHKAYVASTRNLKAGFVKFVSPEALTCLALHPTEEYFATGDAEGNIRLWYCLHDAVAVTKAEVEKRAPTSTLHWHAHAVSALTFTPNGAYLLSGGEESVLVIWQIHSGKKEFVPRVGAPIDSVAVSRTQSGEEEYLLHLADASLVFIGSSKLKISRSYSGIKLGECSEGSQGVTDHLDFQIPQCHIVDHQHQHRLLSPYTRCHLRSFFLLLIHLHYKLIRHLRQN